MPFVHLHTHSEYSLLDGANRIPELVAHVKKLGMDSLAVTDHGNMHAAWSFYEEAKAQKIRPILGFEAYLAYGPRQAREKPSWAPAAYSHLVLLARNRTGYKNLVRLTSIGYTEGFYRRPRIDKDVLAAHADGIVGLAACLSGEIAHALRAGKYEEAKASAEWFARLFGPDGFWLEIQQHGIAEERLVTEGMLRLGAELGLGLVATNCVNAFSYGYDKLRFIKPVFVGDTIYSIRTNLDKTPRYKEMGLIRASYEVFKGEGELVLYCEHLQTVKYKNPADFVGKTEK